MNLMTRVRGFLGQRRVGLVIGLVVFIGSVYLMFYSANYREFGDSSYLYNITASMARYGDPMFDLMAYNWPDRVDNTFYSERLYPLYYYQEDWLSVLAAMPFYWLAYQVPGLGLIHTVWLLNVAVGAAACVLMFYYALALGWRERTALLAALGLGVTTILLPYSTTFLSEPVTLLATLAFAYTLERWRAGRYRSWGLLALSIFLLVCMFAAKKSTPFALPGLLIILVPNLDLQANWRRWWRWLEGPLFVAVMALMAAQAFVNLLPAFKIFTPITPPLLSGIYDNPYTMIAMRTYLFSFSASIWGSSPLLLLAFPGGWLLWRGGYKRYVWVALLVTAGYTLGYALLRWEPWYGSVTWPPRFMVPILPFLMLMTLPVLEKITYAPVSRMWQGIAALLALYGAWIQFNGVSYQWDRYDKLLPAGTLMTQGEAAFNISQMPWVLLPKLWGHQPFDFIWVRTGHTGFMLLFGLLAVGCLIGLSWLTAGRAVRRAAWMSLALPVMFVLLAGVSLRAVYIDPLYAGERQDLHDMLDVIDHEARTPDMVFVTGAEHVIFMLNYGKTRQARLVGLPYQPGERYSPEQPAEIVSDDVLDLLDPTTPLLLRTAALRRDRLWLLVEFSPFHWWAHRPVERFMTQEFYPLRELSTAPAARLIEYATAAGGEPAVTPTDLVWQGGIRLTHVTLAAGGVRESGQTLPFTLHWHADEMPGADYTVAVFLVDGNGVVVAQGMDSAPVGGFSPTGRWQTGQAVDDNRALRLPAELPGGTYQLWVRLYSAPEGQIITLPVQSGTVIGDDIAVLPVIIDVIEPTP